jgi:hypothetical protein
MDKRIVSSSVSGYIILGGLADSTYHLSFGFPKNEWPGQNVTITIKETDAGYLLKNPGEKGWVLFNLQTMQVLIPEKGIANKDAAETETLKDDFSTILAAVVNDPRIAQRIITRGDTLAAEKSPEFKVAEKPLVKEEGKPGLNKAGITKMGYDAGPGGINITYLDIVNGIADTIQLVIPYAAVQPVKQAGTAKQAKTKDGSTNKDERFIGMELQNPNAKTDTVKVTDQVIREKKPSSNELTKALADSPVKEIKATAGNSKCKTAASYDDFINLRKLMAAEESYEGMINTAHKKFRMNCYTTEQVKNLGTMFLNDEGKYRFYVSAYPFVLDSQNFVTLENQLTDKFFITKFRAILH